MKILVISLERAAERRTYISSHLQSLGLDFEIVDAQDYREMSPEDFSRLTDEKAVRLNPYLTEGVQACAISHQRAYQKLITEGLEMAMVLEDDTALSENIKPMLAEIAERIDQSEVVSLNYYSHTEDQVRLSTVDTQQLSNGASLLLPVSIRQVGSAMAYVLTRGVAARMLEKMAPITVAADDWGAFYKNTVFTSFRCAYPPLAKPALFSSTLDYPEAKTFKGRLAAFIKNYKVPLLSQYLKQRSQKVIDEKYVFELSDALPFNTTPNSQVD